MRELTSLISQRPVLSFCVVTFAMTVPALAFSGSNISVAWQLPLLMAACYVPALAALLLSGVTQDRQLLWQRITRWRAGWVWYAAGLLMPLASWSLAAGVLTLLTGPLEMLPANALLLPAIFIINLGEEVGWRGFALPHLLRRYSPLASSLILGLVWVAFHAPLYWQRPLEGLFLLAPIIPLSILLTWLFVSTGECLLPGTLLHAAFNIGAQVLLVGEALPGLLAVETLVLVMMAVYIASRSGFVQHRQPHGGEVTGGS